MRIHTSFNQAVTSTGRLSSSNPNLQNIPPPAHKIFICDEGHVLLSADYSQIELRLLAHISQDKAMLCAFRERKDIHSQTAAEVFGVKEEQVDERMRRVAKVINFGITYGMSPYGLSKELGISRAQAKEFIERYFARFPNVKEYIEKTIDFARKHGYVETLWGRRRYLGDINSKNEHLREYAERAAVNAPIQGSAADVIKLAIEGLAWLCFVRGNPFFTKRYRRYHGFPP